MSALGSVLATPRWIALTLLAVVALVLCTLAGTWQWTRTQDILALERAALAEPVAVQDITTVDGSLPAESVGRPVIVVGRYDGAQQRYVTNRALDGRAGLWVLAPVVLPDGTRVPVLRGWVSQERPVVDAPPDGPVRVEGILQPGETFYADAPVGPDGRLTAVSDAALRQAWGDGVRTGVVVLAEQAPPSVLGPRPVPPTVGPPDVGFPLQNFFYAFQWWFFAAFVVFAWARWLWLDVREAQARQPETEAAAAGG